MFAGTDPGELATGAAAGKLAVKWDKLKLRVGKIEAHELAAGSVGYVRAEVVWPFSKQSATGLRLAAVCVRDGTAWKWVVLDFQVQ